MALLREELHRHRDVLSAVASKHGASNLRLFGSVVRGEEPPDSDVDLLIDMADDRGFDDYLALVQELEDRLRVEFISSSGAVSAPISVLHRVRGSTFVKTDLPYLGHIADSIAAIETYVGGGRAMFMKERLIQDAVIRNFEVIGEAASRLSRRCAISRAFLGARLSLFGTTDLRLLER